MPNNILFLLAIHPPADVASLKRTLKRVTAPLQSRLRDLLAQIGEAVTLGMSEAAMGAMTEDVSMTTTNNDFIEDASNIVSHGASGMSCCGFISKCM